QRMIVFVRVRSLAPLLSSKSVDDVRTQFDSWPVSKDDIDAFSKLIARFGGSIVWLNRGYRKAAISGTFGSLGQLPARYLDEQAFGEIKSAAAASGTIHPQDSQSGPGNVYTGTGVFLAGLAVAAGATNPWLIGIGLLMAGTGGSQAGWGFGQMMKEEPSP